MSLKSNKRVIIAKDESVYGTDSVPTGSEAILVRNLNFTPLNAEVAQRDLIRPYFGNSDTLIAATNCVIDFEVELAGAGATGALPGYDTLLKSCGLSPTVSTIVISSLTRASQVATADCASAHGLTTGDTVKISGATQTEYNGNFTVTVTDSDSFTYVVTGSPATPATGSPVLNTQASYAPISSSIQSSTIYFNVDGVLHKLTGARGSVEINIAAKQIPVFKFTFTGLSNTVTDTSAVTPTYTSFQQPKVAITEHTTGFSLFSYSGVLASMNLNLANEVFYRNLIGAESVEIIDRKPAGSFVIEAPLMASKNFFALAEAGTTGALAITHGTVGGNKVALTASRVSISNPNYQDDNGIMMLSIPFVLTPSSGNDELAIVIK